MKKTPYTVQLIRLYGLLVAVVASLVEADYQLDVTVHSFSLLRNRCALCYQGNMTEMDQCCDYDPPMPSGSSPDGSCAPMCDVLFFYGHGKLGQSNISITSYPKNSPIILNNFNATNFTNFSEAIRLLFQQSNLIGEIFYMEFRERDIGSEGPHDIIDRVDVNVDIPVGASINRTTYTGKYNNTQVELSFRVVCAKNYYGPDCTQFCNDSSCPCDPGFTGEFCETNINGCEGVNCSGHGKCEDGINSFVCECDLGFTGELCEMNIDYCEGVNCSGNGTCTQTIGSFSCQCNEPFTGHLCEIKIEPCKDEVCGPNGQCVVKMNTYTCDCDPGFTGEACEQQMISVCENVSCSGNGHCEEYDNGATHTMYRCVCDSGFTGTDCKTIIDSCSGVNCEDPSNNGFSNNLIGPVIGGVLGAVIFVLIVLVTIVLVVLLLRRRRAYNNKGPSNAAIHGNFTTKSSNLTESTKPLVSPQSSSSNVVDRKSTIDRDFQNPLYGGEEDVPDNVIYDQTENTYDVTVHNTVHTTTASEPTIREDHLYDEADVNLESPFSPKAKDECEFDVDPNQKTLRNFKNPVYGGDEVDSHVHSGDDAKLKTLKNLKNPIYDGDTTEFRKNSRPHEYADVGPVYASLENEHDRAERYASKAAAEFRINSTERSATVGFEVGTATDDRLYEDVA